MTCFRLMQNCCLRFSLRFPLVRAAVGLCFLLLAGLLPADPARAAYVASLIARGNKAYTAGAYKKALDLYDQAAKKEAQPIISYDRGNALYRLGNFEEARQAYDKAVDDLKNPELVSRGYYNMGNAAYRQGEIRQQQEPDKAMTLFSESASAYREALRRDPGLAGAGANLELADRKIKELAALKRKLQKEQRQDKAEGNKKQATGQDAKGLKDLANRQKQLAEQTDKLQNDKQNNAAQKKKATDSLAARQQKLRRQTEKKAQAGESERTRKDLQDATTLQKKAEEELHRNQLAQAAKLQKKAAKKLQQAAAAEGQKEEKPAANRQRQNKTAGEQTKKKEQTRPANEQGKDNQTAKEDQNGQASAAPQLDPRQILNQERFRRQLHRQRMTAAGSLRVDKDW